MDARIVATERFLPTPRTRAPTLGRAREQTSCPGSRCGGGYNAQLKELKFQLESARLQVGVAMPATRATRRFASATTSWSCASISVNTRAASRPRRCSAACRRWRASSARATNAIDGVVQERVASMRNELEIENTNVEGYRNRLGALETEAEDVVGGVTAASFASVRARFYDLVQRADVGNIDVSWADREEHRQRVELLTRQRATEIRALDDEFQEIMDEPKGEGQ